MPWATRDRCLVSRRLCAAGLGALLGLLPLEWQDRSGLPILTAAEARPNNLTREYELVAQLHRARKYQEALQRASRLLPIFRARFGENHVNVAQLLETMGLSYEGLGQSAAAEPLHRTALEIREKALGSNHPDVARSLVNLADVYENVNRFVDAEALYKRALAILEKARGPNHLDVTHTLNNLAFLYAEMGRYGDAESIQKRILAIQEKILAPNHPDLGTSLTNLARTYQNTGRYTDAEPLHRRALAVWEKAFGPNHPDVALSLINLSLVYAALGRYGDAEPLCKRAIAIAETALGPNHPDLANPLYALANVYLVMGRPADAEPLQKRALAIRERALGPNHLHVAASLDSLAVVYDKMGRYEDAEALHRRALAIRENALGPNSLGVAVSLNNLANLYRAAGRFEDAEPLYKRALAIKETSLGDHPDIANGLNNLAGLSLQVGHIAEAAEYSRRAVRIAVSRLAREMGAGLRADVGSFHSYVYNNLGALYHARAEKPLGPEAVAEAFEVAQWAEQTTVAAALNQMAARFATGSDALAALVRDQQDAAAERQRLDKSLLAEIAKPAQQRDRTREGATRRRMAELDTRLAQLNARLAAEFPRFADLVSPKPLSIPEVQKLLGPREALLLFYMGDCVWAVTRERAEWRNITLSRADLDKQVEKLRAALDPEAPTNGSQLFDLEAAHALYAEILGPVEDVIADKPDLIVVASGTLTSLPFHVLVTEKPAHAAASPADYGSAAWLMRRHAVTVLPSVASLKTLREIAVRSRAPLPYLGFGDPVFSRSPQQVADNAPRRGARAGLAYRGYFRGARADLDGLSRALPPLPDTADELRAVARTLGVPESQIKLRGDASERAVKTLPLANYRILHFATHALVAGETAQFNEQAEPALALSLPQTPSDLDDGLLTSSEVAALKLNADWVILSACNTAAGDKPGAEALSGLARAFFYAGARTLLVSHWPVDSQAAVRLTTATIQALEEDRTLTPAEGLRRAMLALMSDASEPRDAYPGIWAPFIVVGESR